MAHDDQQAPLYDAGGAGFHLLHPGFGVRVDAGGDQSAGVQRWLDALKRETFGSRGILPAYGVVEIGRTLRIENVTGLSIRGPGPAGFRFRWIGPPDQPMFQLSNCKQCSFEGFMVLSHPSRPLHTAFHIQDLTEPPASNANVFRLVSVEGINTGGLGHGFVIEPRGDWPRDAESRRTDRNNDFQTLHHVAVTNYSEAAVTIRGYNAHNIQMVFCDFIAAPGAGKHGVDCHGGFFSIRGGRVSGNQVADFSIAVPNGAIHIADVNVEGSRRLLVTDGPQAAGQPISIEHVRWAADGLDADREMIRLRHPGPLSLRGNVFGDANGPGPDPRRPIAGRTLPRVRIDPMTYYGFVSHGNTWVGEDALTTTPYRLPAALPGRVSIEGDVFVKASVPAYVSNAFPDGEAEPAVHTGRVFSTRNTRSTSIHGLAQGYPSQQVVIVARDPHTTIRYLSATARHPIRLRTGTDRPLANGQAVELLFTGEEWVEL
jgi:hypothetical protein